MCCYMAISIGPQPWLEITNISESGRLLKTWTTKCPSSLFITMKMHFIVQYKYIHNAQNIHVHYIGSPKIKIIIIIIIIIMLISNEINKSDLQRTVTRRHNASDSLLSITCCNFTFWFSTQIHWKKLNNSEVTMELSIIHLIIITCTYKDTKQIN